MTSLDTTSLAEPARQNSQAIVIFDTTLRDGEQSPGASMTLEEKLQVAGLLDAMGVDIIEAGFPVTSEGDFEAVSAIAKRMKRASVAGNVLSEIARAGRRAAACGCEECDHKEPENEGQGPRIGSLADARR